MGGGKILSENTSKKNKALATYLGKNTSKAAEVENLGILWYTGFKKHGLVGRRGKRRGRAANENLLLERVQADEDAECKSCVGTRHFRKHGAASR
jgi:hypothetical protein